MLLWWGRTFAIRVRGLRSVLLISGIAGAAKVFLTGALVWAIGLAIGTGSRRFAAALAMLGVIGAGVYMGIDSYLSMNSFDPVFWMTCALALIRIATVYAEIADVGGRVRSGGYAMPQ